MSAADIAFGAPCGATPGNAAGCPTGAPGGGGAWYAVGGGGRRRRLGGQRAGHDRLMRLVSFVTGGPGRGHRSYAYSALRWILVTESSHNFAVVALPGRPEVSPLASTVAGAVCQQIAACVD